MTEKELIAKYPENRDEMSEERHREFVDDLFSCYEGIGFAKAFWSPYTLIEGIDSGYFGKPFEVVARCEEGEDWDLECLPAWRIRFEDGREIDAYPEEIVPLVMAEHGYREEEQSA